MNTNTLKIMPIDTLNHKIIVFSNELKVMQDSNDLLKNQIKILSDSVRTLGKTIERAGVKTEFFSDQLGFQLFWFSLLVAVVGLISWRSLFKPIEKDLVKINEEFANIKKEVDKISTEKLTSLKNEIIDLIDDKTTAIENDFHDLSLETHRGINLGLDSLKEFYKLNRNWPMYILYKLRIIERHFIVDDFDDEEVHEKIIEDLKDLLNTVEGENLNLSKLTTVSIEVINIFSKILNEECHHDIKSLSQEILGKINFIEKSPETSFDADSTD